MMIYLLITKISVNAVTDLPVISDVSDLSLISDYIFIFLPIE